MDFEKFTKKSIECISGAEREAQERANPEIDELHLLFSLLSDAEGLIPELIRTMGKNPRELTERIDSALNSLPRLSGSGYSSGRVYISPSAEKALKAADKKREKMKDEYLSVEHIMLALFDSSNEKIKAAFSSVGIKESDFLAAL